MIRRVLGEQIPGIRFFVIIVGFFAKSPTVRFMSPTLVFKKKLLQIDRKCINQAKIGATFFHRANYSLGQVFFR